MADFKIKQAIKETNIIFKDFGIQEKLRVEDWEDKSVIAIENYRKSKIDNYLNGVIENSRMSNGKLR